MKMIKKVREAVKTRKISGLSLSYLDNNSEIVVVNSSDEIITHFKWNESRVSNFIIKHGSIIDSVYGEIRGIYSQDGEFFVIKVESRYSGYFDPCVHEDFVAHDELLNTEIWLHGTAAFHKNIADIQSIIANTRAVIDMANSESGNEICAARIEDSQWLGNCGVALKGVPVVASITDLYSFKNEDGTRTFLMDEHNDTLYTDKGSLVANANDAVYYKYSEVLLKPRKIMALWCRRSVSLKLRMAILKLAREVGVKMILLA